MPVLICLRLACLAISRLEPDWWLEIENTYKDRIAQRKELYRLHGNLILDWQHEEDVEVACRELMELVVMWLEKRYPSLFQLLDDPEVSGGKILVNNILQIRTYLNRNIHPLMVLLDHVWVLLNYIYTPTIELMQCIGTGRFCTNVTRFLRLE